MNSMRKSGMLVLVLILISYGSLLGQTAFMSQNLGHKFKQIGDTTTWKLTGTLALDFPAHHPQGMVKIGPHFFVSSVEVLNRGEGKGIGHLFKFDSTGSLLAHVTLGEGSLYHPGGIDYDGEYLWVPVAEYRPSSRSVVYKVRPETLAYTEVLRFDDHLGGIVHDPVSNSLHAISWGSRYYYDWKLNERGQLLEPIGLPTETRRINPAFYIDYQDCHYVGNHQMLCGGLKTYKNGGASFSLGGLDLVDLPSHRPIHQVPVLLRSPSGRPMTQNPFWLENTPTGVRFYFIPDDDTATLFVYEIDLKEIKN